MFKTNNKISVVTMTWQMFIFTPTCNSDYEENERYAYQ